jgi:hypothetical protein
MIGMPMIPASPLLDEIRSRHPNGIYTANDFIDQVKPGNIFYAVQASPYSGVTSTEVRDNLYCRKTLVLIQEYSGSVKELKGQMVYTILHDRSFHFLSSLFNPGNACFVNAEHAESYRIDLRKNIDDLVCMV